MTKEKFGPRASVRELKTFQDVDWFVSKNGWALVSKEVMGGGTKEVYLTPAGNMVGFVLSSVGNVLTVIMEFE